MHEVSDVVRFVEGGKNSDIAAYEAEGWVCNIAKKPTVTREEAFKSSFAIVKDSSDTGAFKLNGSPVTPPAAGEEFPKTPDYIERYYRAMEVIYALNTDTYFRNLLQYGVSTVNYRLVDATAPDSKKYVVRYTEGSNVYNMELLYTGDVFNAFFCEELGWTEVVKQSVALQNEDSVLPNSN